MDHWEEIRKLVEERRADRIAGRITTLDAAARKEVASRLPGLLKELRGRSDRWDDSLVRRGSALRVAGAGTLGGAAAVASWLYRRDFAPQWAGPDNDVNLVLAVIADRPAAWRADLAERLALRTRAADDRGMTLALTLLRETGVEPPAHDPLAAGWVSRRPARLAADPLLGHLLPRLFEAQGVGRALRGERNPREGWLAALTGLAETGRVERETLVEGCLRRFLLGGTANDLRFFVNLHEALDPSPEEAARHADDYLRLLAASPGPVATLAVRRLRGCDLAAADLAEAWDCLLFRQERTLVRAGLAWLDRSVRRDPALAAVIAAPLARAFAAESVEIQVKAVELALAHAAAMGEEGRAVVREAAAQLAPHLAERAVAALGDTPGDGEAPVFAVFAPPPLPEPRERSRALQPPPASAGELADLLEWRDDSWQSWERLLAGFVTLVVKDREAVTAALRPWLLGDSIWPSRGETWERRASRPPWLFGESAWPHQGETWERTDQWLWGAVRALVTAASGKGFCRTLMPSTDLPAPHRLLLHRAAEVMLAVGENTLPPLLLATPTHDTGHVAAAELVRRMEVVEAAGARPLAADLQQALLRLPRDPDSEAAARAARLTSPAGAILAAWTRPEAEVTFDRPREQGEPGPTPVITAATTGLPLADLMFRASRRRDGDGHLDWWPSTLPSHREVAAAHLVPYALVGSWGTRTVRLEQARDLVRAEGPVGEAFSTVLARTLGDPRTSEAADVLVEAAARDGLPVAEIGSQAGVLVAAGRIKVADLTATLDTAARLGAHESVWRIAAAALPTLLPAPGERSRTGLAGFVTLAATVAGWCGARGEIPEVRDLAARRGGSGLLREVRALHDLLTVGPAEKE
ncbi:DUF7824 domain-containing protein [Streptosporangium saharense]|uniref:DUF7824 domain-containing protein n=1 Tax=Streptosporangium saharense TaxID=1706840 RepID=A0A7W7QL65_9ACTN|nr:DUF6493 family protein [Streptosporangium saharense]MBB4915620.1 hypothetical protein [Streptosporangium saharense]